MNILITKFELLRKKIQSCELFEFKICTHPWMRWILKKKFITILILM